MIGVQEAGRHGVLFHLIHNTWPVDAKPLDHSWKERLAELRALLAVELSGVKVARGHHFFDLFKRAIDKHSHLGDEGRKLVDNPRGSIR
jgi:hypothetical protein